jgi:hypothetical protein
MLREMAGSFADSRRIHTWRGIDTCILEQLIMEADQKAYADAMSNGLSNQSHFCRDPCCHIFSSLLHSIEPLAFRPTATEAF